VTVLPVPPSLPASPLALVTGATGYVGGRLVPQLLAAGFHVRVVARRPQNLADREWYDHVDVVQGDAADADSLAQALSGMDVAYYLIHSLGTGEDFESRDARGARAVAREFRR
jgi:uncharacterized protein YbjT (DUF2867 family)